MPDDSTAPQTPLISSSEKLYLTVKSRNFKTNLSLPDEILSKFPDTNWFEAEIKDNKIILTPVPLTTSEDVRNELAQLGITQQDVDDAIAWARRE